MKLIDYKKKVNELVVVDDYDILKSYLKGQISTENFIDSLRIITNTTEPDFEIVNSEDTNK